MARAQAAAGSAAFGDHLGLITSGNWKMKIVAVNIVPLAQ
jgi:hypothetical protein